MTDQRLIRNFSIVAHIDHGKTTLSDRILQRCGAVAEREMHEQMLDDMELEQERGITIKARAVTLRYTAKDGNEYILNLIDTPGHVDFSYEVSRSLAACEGAVLVVDATQGVEAQTLANAYLAIHNNLTIVPVINKIDLPSAEPEKAREQIEQVVGIPADDAVLTSAKKGIGIDELLERIVRDVPPPKGDPAAPLKALLFDSWYDPYRGVTSLVRIFEGTLQPRKKIRAMGTGLESEVEEVGIFRRRGRTCRSSRSARSASSGRTSRTSTRPASATRSPSSRARRRSPCPVSRRRSRWSSPDSFRRRRTTTRTCATRWRSSA